MLKDMAKTAGVLFLITFLVSLMLVVGDYFTKDRIEQRREMEEALAKRQVLTEAYHFEDILLDQMTAAEKMAVGYNENNSAVVGYSVTTSARGYGGDITVMTGVRSDKSIAAVRILTHSETASVGSKAADNPELLLDTYREKTGPFTLFKSKTTDPQGIVAISGATVTSRGVNEAINRALELVAAYEAIPVQTEEVGAND